MPYRRLRIAVMIALVVTGVLALVGIYRGGWLESVGSWLSTMAVFSALGVLVLLHRAARRQQR